MKKIICIALTIFMVLPMLFSCGGTNPTEETTQETGPFVNIIWYTEDGDYQTIAYLGKTPVPPEINQNPQSDKYNYIFKGWDKELKPITQEDITQGDIYFRAEYSKEFRYYDVNFVLNEKVVDTIRVKYGEKVPTTTQTIPDKEGYPYKIWLCDDKTVTKETTVTATYAQTKKYTIKTTESVVDGVYYMPLILETHESGRATPASINTGTGYDSLIFYSEEADGKIPDPNKSVNQILKDLDLDFTKIVDEDDLLDAYVSGSGNYGTTKIVAVNDDKVPFEEARHFSITQKSTTDYSMQLSMNMSKNAFVEGDVLVFSCWIRFVSANVESNCGQIRFSCQHPTSYTKNLNYSISKIADGEWFRFIMTFTAKEDYTNLVIALAGCVQEVEIAGYEVRNCGSEVSIDDIPRDSLASLTNGLEDIYDENAQWRKDAWERIQQIRMGDLTVTVKDENGQVIPNAEVKVEMTEHDFKWGTCIAEILMNNSDYTSGLSAFFNAAVSGTGTKWACYEREPQRALKGHTIAEKLGITYFRGHTLAWDWPISHTTNADNTYKFDDNIPERLWAAMKAGNKSLIYQYYEEWFKLACETFDYVGEWDVLNEPRLNSNLRDIYGLDIVKHWFDWARKYSKAGTKLYINETTITNARTSNVVDYLINMVHDFENYGISFDGIGIQGHTDEFASPVEFYNNLVRIAELGYEMKVTEFDCGKMMKMYPYAEASFVRDVLILCFSIEAMDGFYMWGFWDDMSSYGNAPLFDSDWNLKLSGEQYLDLVYNQWWTRESGNTDAQGKYTTRAYYGTYDITVTVNGKTVTQTVSMVKGETGDFTIVVK